jgi:hypothetical protein
MFDMDKIDALNSATKYPSIPTYHVLGDRGALTEDRNFEFDGPTYLTEKIDGTNARIVLLPGSGDYLIGSREELLHARGDRIANPAQGIVAALKDLAERVCQFDVPLHGKPIMTLYLEVYGGRITGQSKQYSAEGTVGYRLFDINWVSLEVLDWERERIASWRDNGGQSFFDVEALQSAADGWNIPTVPYLGEADDVDCPMDGNDLPKNVEDMAAFLAKRIPESLAALDDNAGRRPEGLVLRNADRTQIAKARFQDYERTLKRRNKGQ